MRSVNVLLLLMLSFHEMISACKYIVIIGRLLLLVINLVPRAKSPGDEVVVITTS